MRRVDAGVPVLERPQRYGGVEVGARMTVLALEGGLLVHSPLAVDPTSLADLGEVRWVVSPNKLHHLYVKPWADAGFETWAAPGLPEKRPDVSFAGVLQGDISPFGDEVGVFPLACFPFANEVVLHHRPSRTLVVTDLVFHFTEAAPWATRAAMRLLWGYPGCSTTLLERVGFRRDIARQEVRMLADLDFDRLVMAHGEIIDTGGKDAFLGAMRWLGG